MFCSKASALMNGVIQQRDNYSSTFDLTILGGGA